jgi:hypothetical protein
MMGTKAGMERGLAQLCQVVNRMSDTRSGRGEDMNKEETIAWIGLREIYKLVGRKMVENYATANPEQHNTFSG